jgi:ArsR family transcriptional regulator, arsenate/arsenite/antimonite-responsive transcriptional repressor
MRIDALSCFQGASTCVNMEPTMAPAQSMPTPALGEVSLPVLDCTPLFSGAPLDQASATRLASILKVLGDAARLRLLSLIQAQPSHEACVCHLTDTLDLSQPTVSHHLRVLFEAGLLERERRGNWVYYRTVPGALDGVLEALAGRTQVAAGDATCDDDCCCS